MSFHDYLNWRRHLPLPAPDAVEQAVDEAEAMDDAMLDAAMQRRVREQMALRERSYDWHEKMEALFEVEPPRKVS